MKRADRLRFDLSQQAFSLLSLKSFTEDLRFNVNSLIYSHWVEGELAFFPTISKWEVVAELNVDTRMNITRNTEVVIEFDKSTALETYNQSEKFRKFRNPSYQRTTKAYGAPFNFCLVKTYDLIPVETIFCVQATLQEMLELPMSKNKTLKMRIELQKIASFSNIEDLITAKVYRKLTGADIDVGTSFNPDSINTDYLLTLFGKKQEDLVKHSLEELKTYEDVQVSEQDTVEAITSKLSEYI